MHLKAVCLECNDDQLHSLCRELSTDYGLHTSGLILDDAGSGRPELELRQADLLVTTSFHADEVHSLAARLGGPWIAVHLGEELMEETIHRLRAGPVYFVGCDPRWETKLHEIFGALGLTANLRPMLVGRDDLSVIPDDAPTLLMQLARERIEDPALVARVTPTERVFSRESSREILSFIVNANLRAMQT